MICIGDKITFIYSGRRSGKYLVTNIFYSLSFCQTVIEIESENGEKSRIRGKEIEEFKLKKIG